MLFKPHPGVSEHSSMALDSRIQSDLAVVSGSSSRVLCNRYGYFDAATDDFVIENVLTPRPWINTLSNGRYGLLVSQMGGGFSWLDNSQTSRLTRWEQDLAIDGYGRWVYLHDPSTGRTHSTTFAPVREPADFEQVRHGLGYSTFTRRIGDLETVHTVFVPRHANCERQIVEVRNHGGTDRDLVLGTYAEWQLGAQGEWHREFHRLFVSVEASGNVLLAGKRRGLEEGTRDEPHLPMTAYASIAGLEGVEWFADKAQWLGPAGRLDRPDALQTTVEPRVTGRWDDPIAAARARLTIPAGGSVAFVLTYGAAEDRASAAIAAETTLEEARAEFEETLAHYRDRYGASSVETDDDAFDLLNNAWLPYQTEVGRMQARSAYFQQGGAFGYRDQLQDSLAFLEIDPATTLNQIGTQAEAMYEDGGVRHWWHPETEIFAESRHSDTCLWLAFGVLEYLNETGDLSVLDRDYRYLSRETQAFSSTGSLLDHCRRGIERMLARRSARGLPLIGAGDWNDGLSHAGIDGKGESVWLAMFGYSILRRMAEVLVRRGDETAARRYRQEAESLRQAVDAHGWDGDWYIAGTNDEGRPFGAAECPEGRIFLNPQTWAQITGIGPSDRVAKALASAKESLVRPYGALLLAPAYRNVDPFVGYITRYAPGLRENGGVYSHASTWAVLAFAEAGDLETAYAIYRGMMPPARAAADADVYQAEPYVMPGNVDGPDSPFEGRAGWTWYTGSAAWMRRVAFRGLLGIRATLDGLEVSGRIPAELGRVTVRRPFRGDVFEIEIEPNATRILVDGEPHAGGPIAASGQNRVRRFQALG